MQRVVKATTRKGKRALIKREPKIVENVKQTLCIVGRKTHDIVWKCMKNLYSLKKPDATLLNRKHDILPFENVTPIERLCQKYDASLFMFASHTKKRPNNLTLGRLYDGHLLDMFELGIELFNGFDSYDDVDKPAFGSKPLIIFIGEEFETHNMSRLKSLLVDLLHGQEVTALPLNRIEHVFMFLANGNNIILRTYKINLEATGDVAPRVELKPLGPCADFSLRRKVLASDDLFKRASTKPKTKGKKIKGIRRDAFGSKVGTVHVSSQNINKLQTRKMKGLKKSRQPRNPNEESTSVVKSKT